MKMKTTLCAVLLSLTSVSMIACDGGHKSNSAEKTHVSQLVASEKAETNDQKIAQHEKNIIALEDRIEALAKPIGDAREEMNAAEAELKDAAEGADSELIRAAVANQITKKDAFDSLVKEYKDLSEDVEENKTMISYYDTTIKLNKKSSILKNSEYSLPKVVVDTLEEEIAVLYKDLQELSVKAMEINGEM